MTEEPLSFSQKCVSFLINGRKILLALLVSFCVIVAAVVVFVSVQNRNIKHASEATEMLINDWMKLRSDKPENMTEQENELIKKIEVQAEKNGKSYAGFRAYTVLGEIYSTKKEWEHAMTMYEKAAVALPKSYTAGIAYFNAGACADELKQYEKSLEFYMLSSQVENFPLRPRAFFNVGRLEEQLAHSEKAIEAYNKLSELYPDNNWALLGKSRIIALTIAKK